MEQIDKVIYPPEVKTGIILGIIGLVIALIVIIVDFDESILWLILISYVPTSLSLYLRHRYLACSLTGYGISKRYLFGRISIPWENITMVDYKPQTSLMFR